MSPRLFELSCYGMSTFAAFNLLIVVGTLRPQPPDVAPSVLTLPRALSAPLACVPLHQRLGAHRDRWAGMSARRRSSASI